MLAVVAFIGASTPEQPESALGCLRRSPARRIIDVSSGEGRKGGQIGRESALANDGVTSDARAAAAAAAGTPGDM